MVKNLSKFLFVLLILLLLTIDVLAQREKFSVNSIGARPTGMGNAFVSVANDGNTVSWNPAGMATMNYYINFSFACFPDIDQQTYYASVVKSLTDKWAIGGGWLGSRTFNDELDNEIHLAGSYNLYTLDLSKGSNMRWSWGGSWKHSKGDDEFNIASLFSIGGFNYGIVFSSSTQNNSLNEVSKSNKWRSGISYKLSKSCLVYKYILSNPLIALDFDNDRLYVGLEFLFRPKPHIPFAIRAGFEKDQHSDDKSFSIGLGFNMNFKMNFMNTQRHQLNLDYAHTNSPEADRSDHIGISMTPSKEDPDLPMPGHSEPEVCHNKITVKWFYRLDVEGFQIKRKAGRKVKEIILLGRSRDNYPDDKVKPGNTYEYQIRAFDNNFYSPSRDHKVTATNISWMCDLNIKHDNKTIKLTFGQAPNAKNDLDGKLCEKNETPPQSGEFDARFNNVESLIDFRPVKYEENWYVNLQAATNSNPIKVSWDPNIWAADHSVNVHLKYPRFKANNTVDYIEDVDMKDTTRGSAQLDRYNLTTTNTSWLKIEFKKRSEDTKN